MADNECNHSNKYYYKTNDDSPHWICRDCGTTDLG